MEECGCACVCQLVAAQCGKILQFGPQSKAGKTQMCKHRHTQRDENTTKHRPDLKTGINTDSPNLVYFVSVVAFQSKTNTDIAMVTGTQGYYLF